MKINLCKKIVILIGIIFISILAYDLLLWKRTRDRISVISSLRGESTDEAYAFLEKNNKELGIVTIKHNSQNGDEWFVVKLRKVSIIGVLFSWLNSRHSSSIEISGTLCIYIENGKVTSCLVVF